MARARNIKPGFFKNEELAECSLAARLLAPGLWMMADREGRLEDRPKRLKAEIFPYDNFDVNQLLEELVQSKHIVRYVCGGQGFIQINKFSDHQRPHNNEPKSEIPPMSEGLPTLVESAPNKIESASVLTTVSLTTDSLIPSSLNAECLSIEVTNVTSHPDTPRRDRGCPAQEIVSVWNEVCGERGLPKVEELSAKRKATIKQRWHGEMRQNLDRWKDFCNLVVESPFHLGQNDRAWRANIEWALRPDNITKMFEQSNAPPGTKLKDNYLAGWLADETENAACH